MITEHPGEYMIAMYELFTEEPEPRPMDEHNLHDLSLVELIEQQPTKVIDGEQYVKLSDVLELLGYPLLF